MFSVKRPPAIMKVGKVSVMSSAKESLRHTIELLSDEEARQILEFIQHLLKKKDKSSTLRRLASDSAFKAPSERSGGFRVVESIRGKGIPASKLLEKDRT